MNPPRISVVIPVRNAERHLRAATESIRDQSLSDWELVIVDDGSTDESRRIARRLANDDDRLRLLATGSHGIAAALNLGCKQAQGKYIARMDADDVSHRDRLRRQAELLDHDASLGLVGCGVEFGGDRRQAGGFALHVDWLNGLTQPRDIALNRFVESPLAHPSVMFRRELLDRLGGYLDGPIPEDYELWLRWLDAGVRMAKVPEVLLTWNDSPNRLSRTDPRYSPRAFYEVKARYLARAIEPTRGSREVWIWGAGRPTRQRAELLTHHGISIAGYIDIDPRKTGRRIGHRPVVTPAELPTPERAMIISYVGSRGARGLIREQLHSEGFLEGHDFWMAA